MSTRHLQASSACALSIHATITCSTRPDVKTREYAAGENYEAPEEFDCVGKGVDEAVSGIAGESDPVDGKVAGAKAVVAAYSSAGAASAEIMAESESSGTKGKRAELARPGVVGRSRRLGALRWSRAAQFPRERIGSENGRSRRRTVATRWCQR